MNISWFPEEFVPGPGQLGLTSMPGAEGTLEQDLETLLALDVSYLVCLLEGDELRYLEPPETIEARKRAVEQRGIRFLHQPIEDFKAPSLTQARQTVASINEALQRGETVMVHCWAGLGRAGTIAACVLVQNGMSAQDAIATVRWIRLGAIQSDVQEHLIARFGSERAP